MSVGVLLFKWHDSHDDDGTRLSVLKFVCVYVYEKSRMYM